MGIITAANSASALSRWEKVVGREIESAEYFAGIISRVAAFLFGYAEIINRNKHLNVSDKLYDGEKSECYKYGFFT